MTRRKSTAKSRKTRTSTPKTIGIPIAPPINLREQYGHRYKIEFDPAHVEGDGDDPWLQVIPGHHGEVFPHGGGRLAARSYRRGPVAGRLLGLACCEAYQDGDDGVTVLFRPEDFKTVAREIKPKTRRTLSEKQRAALRKGGEASRFRKKPPQEPA